MRSSAGPSKSRSLRMTMVMVTMIVCPADDGLGHEDSDNGDDDIIENESE